MSRNLVFAASLLFMTVFFVQISVGQVGEIARRLGLV